MKRVLGRLPRMFAWSLLPLTVAWASPASVAILIDGLSPYYSPYSASVSMGVPVVWKNPTASPHTVTHEGCREGVGCAFDSGAIYPGGSFHLPSLPPGVYPYYCTLHPIMKGILEVREPSGPAAT